MWPNDRKLSKSHKLTLYCYIIVKFTYNAQLTGQKMCRLNQCGIKACFGRKPVAALHQGVLGQITWLEDPPP